MYPGKATKYSVVPQQADRQRQMILTTTTADPRALASALDAQLEWQLDALRERRNERLTAAQQAYDQAHDDAWADYNRAVAALSRPPVEAGA